MILLSDPVKPLGEKSISRNNSRETNIFIQICLGHGPILKCIIGNSPSTQLWGSGLGRLCSTNIMQHWMAIEKTMKVFQNLGDHMPKHF